MFSIAEIIDFAVKIEKNGEAVYRRAISQSENQRLKELLLWIADQERDHFDWFQSLLEDMGKQPHPPQVEEMARTMIDDLIGKQTFSLADIDFSRIENSSDLIDIFIEFENDTILFYEMLKSFLTDTATIQHLEKIIQEEASHVEKFEGLRS
jgi:rubrerythrin